MKLDSDFLLDSLEDLIDIAVMDEMALHSEAKVVIPNWVASNADRGLKIRESLPKSEQCCLPVGLARANQLKNKENISLRTLKRMKSFASRHGAQLTPEDAKGKTKRGQAMLIWGITPTKSGVDRFINWVDKSIKKLQK